MCWGSSRPTGRAARAGRTSCRACAAAAWPASSTRFPTITPASGGDPRGAAGGRLAPLLRAFPRERARLRAAKLDDDCPRELGWFYDRRELAEARRDLARRLTKWQGKYPKPTDRVEPNIEETATYLPAALGPS